MRRVSLPKTRPALLIVGTLMAVLMTVTAAQALTGRTPARAGTTTPTAAAVPCQQLTGLDLTALPEAPTRIISATHVAATADKPAYCQVKGYVSPQIQFELRLPEQGWTGRYVQLGCGGFCGFAAPDNPNHFLPGGCAPPDDGRVVLGASNGGHIGVDSRDALWAHSDPQLRIDMAYRSEHVTALVAKAVTKAYYGQAPQYSYFAGCSNGGRQALMEAQRYPDDFDGIIAGAPGNNLVALAGEFFPWIATVNTDDKGRQILGPDKLPLLQSKVMQACDATDGLTDGLINNPRNCDFDPGTLRCPTASPQPTCLTRDQVDVVRKIYQGPVDAKGRRLFPAGLAKGTEAAWLGYVIAPQGQTGGLEALGYNYLKYFSSWNNPPASYTLKDHRFDLRTFKKLREMSGIYDSTDPDLTRFRDRGGKLIMWHGWADPAIPTESTLAYHHALTQRMGGPKATGRFARTFLFPGVYHCVQGYGPDTFDLFTPIYDWVEKGTAPEKITAAKKDGDRTVRTRPVYPYPMQTKYTGTGSIDDAANFTGVMPTEQPDDRYPWVGAPFRSDYQQTCRWEGTKLKCTRTRSA